MGDGLVLHPPSTMTHSLLCRIIAVVARSSQRVTAKNSITVCQPMVMILLVSSHMEDTSTIGPGSRYRRTRLTGTFSLVVALGVALPPARFNFQPIRVWLPTRS